MERMAKSLGNREVWWTSIKSQIYTEAAKCRGNRSHGRALPSQLPHPPCICGIQVVCSNTCQSKCQAVPASLSWPHRNVISWDVVECKVQRGPHLKCHGHSSRVAMDPLTPWKWVLLWWIHFNFKLAHLPSTCPSCQSSCSSTRDLQNQI